MTNDAMAEADIAIGCDDVNNVKIEQDITMECSDLTREHQTLDYVTVEGDESSRMKSEDKINVLAESSGEPPRRSKVKSDITAGCGDLTEVKSERDVNISEADITTGFGDPTEVKLEQDISIECAREQAADGITVEGKESPIVKREYEENEFAGTSSELPYRTKKIKSDINTGYVDLIEVKSERDVNIAGSDITTGCDHLIEVKLEQNLNISEADITTGGGDLTKVKIEQNLSVSEADITGFGDPTEVKLEQAINIERGDLTREQAADGITVEGEESPIVKREYEENEFADTSSELPYRTKKIKSDIITGSDDLRKVKTEQDISIEYNGLNTVQPVDGITTVNVDKRSSKREDEGNLLADSTDEASHRTKNVKSVGAPPKNLDVKVGQNGDIVYGKHESASLAASHKKISCTTKKTYKVYTGTYESKGKSKVIVHVEAAGEKNPFTRDSSDYGCSQACNLNDQKKAQLREKLFACDLCDYSCSRACSFKVHMRTHVGQMSFACNLCGYRCSQVGDLHDHMRTHGGEKPFACDLCDYRSNRSYTLKIHRRTHTGEKPFACDSCEYRCNTAGCLKDHMNIHKRIKPFACNLCDYRGSLARALKNHMRTHTEELPLACDFCDYRCSRTGSLTVHTRIHTGEKPFACDMCDYRTNRSGNLKKHMLTHTCPSDVILMTIDAVQCTAGTLKKQSA